MRLKAGVAFNSDHISSNMAGKTIRGGVSTVGAQFASFVINMIRTVVLARLLTPQDFGLIGMVTVVIGLAEMFKEAGLSTATVQRKEIHKDQISSLFWINVGISLFFALLIAGSAPFVASFYGRDELVAVTIALAIPFFLKGLTIQHNALLMRHMRFGVIAVEKIVSTIVGVIVAIALAVAGFGYWALVGSTIAIAGTTVILTWYFVPWIPGTPKISRDVGDMLKFGGHITAFNFVDYFSRNADNILIGKFIGAGQLGLYSKAYQLFLLPIAQIRNPIFSVALPALSSLQHQQERFVKYYVRMIQIIAIAAFPISVAMALEAEFIIISILGDQWVDAIPVFRILVISGIVVPVVRTRGIVLVSLGYSKRFLYLGIAIATINVSAFIVGLPYGITGVAFAYVTAQYAMLLPTLLYAFYRTPVSLTIFFKSLAYPALITAVSASAVILVNLFLSDKPYVVSLGLLILFFAIYATLAWVFKPLRETISIAYHEFLSKKLKRSK